MNGSTITDLDALGDLDALASAHVDRVVESASPARLELDQDTVRKGLGQIVVTVVKLLHELLEKQALRRIDAGTLSDAQAEALGTTLMLQAREIARLRDEFGLTDDDLNLDLGPLGRLL